MLRPLIGLDKREIIERARQLATYEASSQVQEHCSVAEGQMLTLASAAGGGGRAAAALRPGQRGVGAGGGGRSSPPWPIGPTALPEHAFDRVAEGAVWSTCASPARPHRRPPPPALQPRPRLAGRAATDRTYALVCASGRRSSPLARELPGRGYAAFSLMDERVGLLSPPPGRGRVQLIAPTRRTGRGEAPRHAGRMECRLDTSPRSVPA